MLTVLYVAGLFVGLFVCIAFLIPPALWGLMRLADFVNEFWDRILP